MILNTDTEFKPLKEHQLHKLLTPKLMLLINDIKKRLPGKRYQNLEDKQYANGEYIKERFDIEFYGVSNEHLNGAHGCFVPSYNEIWVKNDLEDKQLYEVLAHEIGHLIQYNANEYQLGESNLLSHEYRFEQQCEAISKILCPMLFGQKYEISYSDNLDTVDWLGKYYGGWLDNDLIV